MTGARGDGAAPPDGFDIMPPMSFDVGCYCCDRVTLVQSSSIGLHGCLGYTL